MCDSQTKDSGTASTEGSLRGNESEIHTSESSIIPLRKWIKSV